VVLKGWPVDRLSIECVRRPGKDLLAELAFYDEQIFGPTGLRPFELALVAWTGRLYLGRVDAQVATCCQLLRIMDRPDYLWVVGLYVRPEWRGQGLGGRTLAWVLEQLPGFGARGVELSVAPDNVAALRLYHSAGFRQVDEVQEMYGPDAHRVMLRYERSEERGE
jgi:ribosomal-protein-alanine N-acetyltransferase